MKLTNELRNSILNRLRDGKDPVEGFFAPEDVKEGCRKLIETCAPGGGYILSAAASMDQGKIENLHAMMDAVREYGVYKKK